MEVIHRRTGGEIAALTLWMLSGFHPLSELRQEHGAGQLQTRNLIKIHKSKEWNSITEGTL